jgi:nucleotide-binding universal stress UspA family protein
MSFPRKVLVAIDINDQMEEMLAPLRKLEFLNNSEINLVHASPLLRYGYPLDFGSYSYPLAEDKVVIEQAVLNKIAGVQEKILPYDFTGTVKIKCLFGDKEAEAFCDYAREINADLVILAPRKSKSFFDSSFCHYVTRHAHNNLLILKQH